MKERRVRFTATARSHVDRERTWWLENRDYEELFANELEAAVRVLSILPGAGSPYIQAGIPELRRLYIRKLTCHLYYTSSLALTNIPIAAWPTIAECRRAADDFGRNRPMPI